MNVPISTTIERMEMMMPKMNFTIPNMTSPTWWRLLSAVGSTLITLVAWLGYMALIQVNYGMMPFQVSKK